MPVSWRISHGIVFIESEGQAALAEWEAAIAGALGSGDFRPGMGLLHDGRRWLRVPTPDEFKTRVSLGVSLARVHGIRRWATVVTSRVHLGMGRIAEAFVQHESSVAFRVFHDLAEAEAWLRESPGLN